MRNLFAKRAGFAVLSGLVVAAVLILMMADGDEAGLAHLHSLGGLAWTFPFVVGACVGLVAWWGLGAARTGGERFEGGQASCPVCGRQIRIDWRLCPDCGTLVEGGSAKSSERPVRA